MKKNPSVSKKSTVYRLPSTAEDRSQKPESKLFKIGEASKNLGVSIDTLRRWEKAGKIETVRTPGGTRLYSLQTLRKINPSVETYQTESLSTEELLRKIYESNQTASPDILSSFPVTPAPSPVILSETKDLPSREDSHGVEVSTPRNDNYKKSLLTKFLIGGTFFSVVILGVIAVVFSTSKESTHTFEVSQTVSQTKSNVLAVIASLPFLEVNKDIQINGSLFVRDTINGLILEATSSANTIALNSGTTTLTITDSALLDQDVSTTSSPSFSSLNLSSASKQITSGANIFTLPSATTTLVGTDTTQTLTNKSMSGSSNTFTNIPNSALTNSKVTVTAGTNLTGGGDMSLGSSVTLTLKDSIALAGVLTLANGTAALPSLAFTNSTSTGFYRDSTGVIGVSTAGTEVFTFSASGIIPTTNATYDLGSSSLKWNNIYATNLTPSGTLLIADGTYSAPSLAFTNDTDSGLWRIGTNAIALTTGGSGVSGIAIDGSGNVGIGTTSPLSKLAVVGNAAFGTYGSLSAPTNGLIVSGNVGIGTTSPFNKLDIAGASVIGAGYAATYTAPSNGLLVQGNVGIGTSAPGYALDVNGTARFAGNISLNSGASIIPLVSGGSDLGSSTFKFNNIYVNNINSSSSLSAVGQATFTYQPTSAAIGESSVWINPTTSTAGYSLLGISIGGTEKARITSDGYLGLGGANTPGSSYIINAGTSFNVGTNGNVGIGVSTAGSKLTVIGNVGIGTSAAGSQLAVNGNGVFGWGTASVAGPANGLGINGNVGIGTTTPLSKLHVTGDGSYTAAFLSGNVGIGNTAPTSALSITGNIDISGGRLSVLTNGNVGVNTATPGYKFETTGSWFLNNSAEGSNLGLVNGGTLGSGTASQYIQLNNAGGGGPRSITAHTYDGDINLEAYFVSGNGNIVFKTSRSVEGAVTEAMRIAYQGNVGIGVSTTVSSKLGISGNTAIGANYGWLAAPTNGLIVEGNVGIGVSSPSQLFSVGTGATSNFTVSSTGVATLGDGSASAPGLAFTGDTDSGLWRIGANQIALTTAGSAFSGLSVNSSGNIGIGTTSATSVLTVLGGNVGIGTSAAGSRLAVNGNGIFGWGTASVAGPANGLGVSGNVGIGTTSPVGALHVVGQCVTGDTILRRKRKKLKGQNLKVKTGGKNPDPEDEYEDVRIDQIKPGDEILSMEPDGTFTWQKVNNLMDMGRQETYKLITNKGKQIRTTGNHPYFVLEKRPAKVLEKLYTTFEIDQSNRLEDMGIDSVVALASNEMGQAITIKISKKAKLSIYKKYYQNKRKLFGPEMMSTMIIYAIWTLGLKAGRLIIDKEYPSYEEYISNFITRSFPEIVVSFRSIGHQVMAHRAAWSRATKKRTLTRSVLLKTLANLDFEESLATELLHSGLVTGDSQSTRSSLLSVYQSPISLSMTMSEARWIPAQAIRKGMLVATVDGWEVITAIYKTGVREQVYDIEVEGTHNFVGNNIVAHNTYLNGSIGVGTLYTNTTTPANGLAVQGNVGIGTTSPSQALHVVGSAQLTGSVLSGDGSNSAPSYSFSGDTDTGLWRIGANQLGLTTAGAAHSGLSINSSGNVGIGTTSATSVLTVLGGNVGIGTSAAGSQLAVNGNGVVGWGTASVAGPSNGLAVFGNVGIGTTSPGSALQISTATNTKGLVIKPNAPVNAGIQPNTISGIKLWLKADAITGLADGDTVTTWTDSSGSGNNATQSTASRKPVYKTNIVNGKPVVRFDSSDDLLSTASVVLATDFTAYTALVVAKYGTGGPVLAQELAGTSNGLLIQQDRIDYHQASLGNNPSFGTSTFIITTVRLSSPDGQTWEDGVSKNTASAASTGSPSATDTTIGNRDLNGGSGGTTGLNGDIAEIIVYDSALSTANRQAIENYLNDKYRVANLQEWQNSSGTATSFVDNRGNLGIGVSAAGSQLAVNGNGVFGWGTASVAGPTNGLGISGNVGVGTTSPLGALHVVGQCVSWDTRIRIRRRRRGFGGQGQDDILEWDYLEAMIKDILPGDEALSLNELTGGFEYQRVEKLLDMGSKGVYELTTLSGKKIKTTGNHPYLTRFTSKESRPTFEVAYASPIEDAGWVKVTQLRVGDQIAVSELMPGTAVGLLEESKINKYQSNYTQEKGNGNSGINIQDISLFGFHNELLNANAISKDNITPTMSTVNMTNFLSLVSFEKLGTITIAANQPADKLINRSAITDLNTGLIVSTKYQTNIEGNAFQRPASRLGLRSQFSEGGNLDVGWDEIVAIKYLGYEHVYDLQIANTHNFVAGHYVNKKTGQALTIQQEEAYVQYLNHQKTRLSASSLTNSTIDTYAFGLSTNSITHKEGIVKLDKTNSGPEGNRTPATRIDSPKAVPTAGPLKPLSQVLGMNVKEEDIVFGGIVAHNTYVTGNVGIGTSSPTQLFSVGTGATSNFTISSTGALSSSANNAALSFTGTTPSISSGANSFSIFSGGNIGIGTSSPLYAALQVKGLGTGTGLTFQTTGSNLTQGLTVLDNGNVGIGITNPTGLLHLRDATGPISLIIENADGNTGTDLEFWQGSTSATGRIRTLSQNPGVDSVRSLAISGANASGSLTEVMRILGSGNVGIGFTSPTALGHIVNTAAADSFKVEDAANDNTVFLVDQSGNVGIGVSGPAAALGYNLDVWGTARITGATTLTGNLTSSGVFLAPDGSSSAPAYSFSGDTDIGLWRIGANQLALTTAGSAFSGLSVNSNGNIGIGTTSATSVLTVLGGNVGIGTSAAGSQLAVNGNGVFGWGTASVAGPANGLAVNGNVGIGVTTTAAKLHVLGSADAIQLLVRGNSTQTSSLQEWQNSAGTALASVSGGGNLSFQTTLTFAGAASSPTFVGDGGGTITANPKGNGSFTVTPATTNGGLSVSNGTNNLFYAGSVTSSNAATERLVLSNRGGASSAGIGTRITFQADNANGNVRNVGFLDTILTATTQFSETSAFIFSLASGDGSATNTVEKMRLTSGGNLGIGTSSSIGTTLAVNGNGAIGWGTTSVAGPSNGLAVNGNVGIGTTTANNALSVVGAAAFGTYSQLTAPSNGIIVSGNVGIGTSASAGLHVVNKETQFQWGTAGGGSGSSKDGLYRFIDYGTDQGASSVTMSILAESSNTNFALMDVRSGSASFLSASSRFFIGGTGNVGVGGDTTPNELFNVGSTSQFQVNSSGAIAAVTGITTSGAYTQSGTGFNKFTGNVGIGASAAGSNLQINGNGVIGWGTASVAGPNNGLAVFGNVGIGTTSPSAPLEVRGSGSSATIAKFTDEASTGCTLATGGTISCSSDINLKKNISALSYDLSDLMKLRPVEFNWKTEDDTAVKNLGFIAQEVETIIPKLVTTNETTGLKELNTIGMIPLLTRSIQQQQTQIASQSAKLNTLLQGLALDNDGTLVVPKIKAGSIILDPSIASASAKLSITDSLVSINADPDSSTSLLSTDNSSGPELSSNNNVFYDLTGKIESLESRVKSLESVSATTVSTVYRLPSTASSSASPSASLAEVGSRKSEVILNLTPPDILYATGSATLANLKVTSEATFSGMLTAYDLNISNSLKSLGITTLGKTNVAGDLTVDGTLSIENGSEINVIGALYLQKSSLAQSLDIFNGKVIVDTSGNITTTGKIAASELKTNKITISTPGEPELTPGVSVASIGTATLPANELKVTVQTREASQSAKIFITPVTITDKVLSAANIKNKESFDVVVYSPSLVDINFNWWIVQTE